jgi:hypothetical protein
VYVVINRLDPCYMLVTMATPIDTNSHTLLIPEGGQTYNNNIPPRHQLQRNRKLSILLKCIQFVRKTATCSNRTGFVYVPSTVETRLRHRQLVT